MSGIIDLTEFGLTGVCIDAKHIGKVYDIIHRNYELFPRVRIHLINTDARLETSQFEDKAQAIDAVLRLQRLRDASKIAHLKSVT